MLSHFERKVWIIIRNTLHTKKEISVKELSIRTGRKKRVIMGALRGLRAKEYIDWELEKPDNIRLADAWRPKQPDEDDKAIQRFMAFWSGGKF